MRALVIPDVHLKPWMFDEADKILEQGLADRAVVLGDLVDDWEKQYNVELYRETMERAIKFHKDHFLQPTVWVMGNHDYSYWHPEFGHRESGHSKIAEIDMRELLNEFYKWCGHPKIIVRQDNCIFSHAGINTHWVKRQKALGVGLYANHGFDIELIGERASGEFLWETDSPFWWRPQPEYGGNPDEAWGKNKYFQVVGHSPMETPTQQGSVLSCDVFSTYRNGEPYGDQSYVVVDTKTREWHRITREEIR